MKIVYNTPKELAEYDEDKFYKSLNRYGNIPVEAIRVALSELDYDPMHYSVLVEIGTSLIPDEDKAREYYQDHNHTEAPFERLRRITGYLVGSLERWNDGKKAEERERVKHNVSGVYTTNEKIARELEKQEGYLSQQDEYHKGD